mgnify:CR=1 FL=1
MQSPANLDCVSVDDLALPSRFKNGLAAAINVINAMDIPTFCFTVLFGSCASGRLKTSSDIDLLIVTKEKILDRELRSRIREQIDQALEAFQVSADIVFYTEQTLLTDNSVFTASLRNCGKILT